MTDLGSQLIGEVAQRTVEKVIKDRSIVPLFKILVKIIITVIIIAIVLLVIIISSLNGQ